MTRCGVRKVDAAQRCVGKNSLLRFESELKAGTGRYMYYVYLSIFLVSHHKLYLTCNDRQQNGGYVGAVKSNLSPSKQKAVVLLGFSVTRLCCYSLGVCMCRL